MTTAAFIGLGVMGAPMCRNLTTKREGAGLAEIRAFDVRAEPLARAGEDGAFIASSATEAATGADVVLVSLPGGAEVEAILTGADGLLDVMQPGAVFVDLSTSPVTLSRELAEKAAAKGIDYADAPVARTRHRLRNRARWRSWSAAPRTSSTVSSRFWIALRRTCFTAAASAADRWSRSSTTWCCSRMWSRSPRR